MFTDWIMSPQNSYVEALTPDVMVIWRWSFLEVMRFWWSYEGEALMMGLVPLKEEAQSSLSQPHLEAAPRRPYLWASKREIPRKWSCWHCDLGLSASKTVKKIFCCLSHWSMVFCYSSLSILTYPLKWL